MKSIGIVIKGKKAILFALEKNLLSNYIILDDKFKSLEIDDHYNNSQIVEFKNTIESFINSISPDRIGIIKRNEKGGFPKNDNVKDSFSTSPISFKIEGILQLCNINIEFIAPQTLNSYIKKNDLPFKVKYNYQIKSAELAFYLLNS